MNLACRTPPKVWTREPILALLVPLRYIPFSFINGKLWLKQSVGLLPGKLHFKQIKMPRDQCRSCLSGCVHLLSEHACPCVFICIPELACGWIIHKVKVLLWDGTPFENTRIYLHLFVTCLSVFTAWIPAVGLSWRFPICLKHTHTPSTTMDIQHPLHILQRDHLTSWSSNNPSMKITKGGTDEKYLIPAVTGLCCIYAAPDRKRLAYLTPPHASDSLQDINGRHYIVSQLCLLCLPQWVLVINVVVCFMKSPRGRGGGHV